MSGVPETTDIPICLKVADEEPVEEKSIKIYLFLIDELCKDNARYWFHACNRLVAILTMTSYVQKDRVEEEEERKKEGRVGECRFCVFSPSC